MAQTSRSRGLVHIGIRAAASNCVLRHGRIAMIRTTCFDWGRATRRLFRRPSTDVELFSRSIGFSFVDAAPSCVRSLVGGGAWAHRGFKSTKKIGRAHV